MVVKGTTAPAYGTLGESAGLLEPQSTQLSNGVAVLPPLGVVGMDESCRSALRPGQQVSAAGTVRQVLRSVPRPRG